MTACNREGFPSPISVQSRSSSLTRETKFFLCFETHNPAHQGFEVILAFKERHHVKSERLLKLCKMSSVDLNDIASSCSCHVVSECRLTT
jgi:hypothetical protein